MTPKWKAILMRGLHNYIFMEMNRNWIRIIITRIPWKTKILLFAHCHKKKLNKKPPYVHTNTVTINTRKQYLHLTSASRNKATRIPPKAMSRLGRKMWHITATDIANEFLIFAHHLMILYICTKIWENISKVSELLSKHNLHTKVNQGGIIMWKL